MLRQKDTSSAHWSTPPESDQRIPPWHLDWCNQGRDGRVLHRREAIPGLALATPERQNRNPGGRGRNYDLTIYDLLFHLPRAQSRRIR